MIVVIPDHFLPNLGGAMVERAVAVINATNAVPAFLHQYASLWDDGIHYGGDDRNFWTACYEAGAKRAPLERQGLL